MKGLYISSHIKKQINNNNNEKITIECGYFDSKRTKMYCKPNEINLKWKWNNDVYT